MAKRDWIRVIRGGETLCVEFKRQVPKLERMSKSMSAFSNSTGGTVFLGIDDEGQVVGLESPSGTRDLIDQVCQFHCSPPIEVTYHDWHHPGGATVLVVEIAEAEVKPVYAVNPKDHKDAWPFFRSGCENLPLDKKSIKTMRRSPSIDVDISSLDRHTVNILNQLASHPRMTVNQLGKSINISPHRAKKIIVDLERNGWIHCFFNEKRREYSLVIDWRHR